MKRRQAEQRVVARVQVQRLLTFAAEIEHAMLASAPPVNAHLSMDGSTGDVRENPVIAAYVEGWHDAWQAVQEFRRLTFGADAPQMRTVGDLLADTCGATHPTNSTVLPCGEPAGHEDEHRSEHDPEGTSKSARRRIWSDQ